MDIRKIILIIPLAVCGFAMACNSIESSTVAENVYVPQAPDYNNAHMWHVELNDRGDGADVFYIPSTWEYDWTTDATPAVLNDTITVTQSPEYKVLVVEGYDGSALPNILDILNTGDYHGAEPWLYSECLRENFHNRIKSFKSKDLKTKR